MQDKASSTAVNRGITSFNNRMMTYEQRKRAFTYFYCKRRVCNDGVTTKPLSLVVTPLSRIPEKTAIDLAGPPGDDEYFAESPGTPGDYACFVESPGAPGDYGSFVESPRSPRDDDDDDDDYDGCFREPPGAPGD